MKQGRFICGRTAAIGAIGSDLRRRSTMSLRVKKINKLRKVWLNVLNFTKSKLTDCLVGVLSKLLWLEIDGVLCKRAGNDLL